MSNFIERLIERTNSKMRVPEIRPAPTPDNLQENFRSSQGGKPIHPSPISTSTKSNIQTEYSDIAANNIDRKESSPVLRDDGPPTVVQQTKSLEKTSLKKKEEPIIQNKMESHRISTGLDDTKSVLPIVTNRDGAIDMKKEQATQNPMSADSTQSLSNSRMKIASPNPSEVETSPLNQIKTSNIFNKHEDEHNNTKVNQQAKMESNLEPSVTITISRIDVKAVTPEEPPSKTAIPSISLEEYLKKRHEEKK